MNKNDQNFMAQKIRTQYMEKQPSELDALRALDSKVKTPANVFAYVFGSISAVIMGAGMSFVMTDLASTIGLTGTQAMAIGIPVGIVGLTLAAVNYPIYRAILKSRKKKYGSEIIALSDKLMKQ